MEYNFWGSLIRLIIFLPLVLLLAYLVIKYGLSKKYIRKDGSYIKVLERNYLNPKATLNVVKIGDKYYLVSSTEQDIKLLKELKDYQETETYENENIKCFLKKLKRDSGDNE